MTYMIMSYDPRQGMGDLDAPFGYISPDQGGWMVGSYRTRDIMTFRYKRDAEMTASRLSPHVDGGRVAVIPAVRG